MWACSKVSLLSTTYQVWDWSLREHVEKTMWTKRLCISENTRQNGEKPSLLAHPMRLVRMFWGVIPTIISHELEVEEDDKEQMVKQEEMEVDHRVRKVELEPLSLLAGDVPLIQGERSTHALPRPLATDKLFQCLTTLSNQLKLFVKPSSSLQVQHSCCMKYHIHTQGPKSSLESLVRSHVTAAASPPASEFKPEPPSHLLLF